MTSTQESKTDAARQAATDAKDAVAEQGQKLAGAAADQARAMTDEVRTQAGSVIEDARQEIETQLDSQARRVGAGMHDASRQLTSMADSAEPGLVANVTQQVAGSLGSIADRIEDGGVGALADDLRSFARRRPALFLVGAGALGFLAARVLRASNTGGASGPRRVSSSSSRGRTDGGKGDGSTAPLGRGTPAVESGVHSQGPTGQTA